ncbi:MAG: hypothetical protein Q8R63_03285 [Ramlibacter sp.]|nr:hypothetical protein [Ramlibacter sp.]
MNPGLDPVSPDCSVRIVTDDHSIAQASALEQAVWHQRNYPGLQSYGKYKRQSRVFVAFGGRECLGITRMFGRGQHTPPFLDAMPIQDINLREKLLAGFTQGTVEELGTTAVAAGARSHITSIEMWRAAFRDAVDRGVDTWGVIMEPERVHVLRRRYGAPYRQVGPAVDYQGGLCAAHVLEFRDMHTHMRANRPEYYQWFVQAPV